MPDIEEAMRQRGIEAEWTAESLALYTQATIQGAFILAKAKHSRELPQSASTICAAISNCCSTNPVRRAICPREAQRSP
jgi:hypothetical protein